MYTLALDARSTFCSLLGCGVLISKLHSYGPMTCELINMYILILEFILVVQISLEV